MRSKRIVLSSGQKWLSHRWRSKLWSPNVAANGTSATKLCYWTRMGSQLLGTSTIFNHLMSRSLIPPHVLLVCVPSCFSQTGTALETQRRSCWTPAHVLGVRSNAVYHPPTRTWLWMSDERERESARCVFVCSKSVSVWMKWRWRRDGLEQEEREQNAENGLTLREEEMEGRMRVPKKGGGHIQVEHSEVSNKIQNIVFLFKRMHLFTFANRTAGMPIKDSRLFVTYTVIHVVKRAPEMSVCTVKLY